MRLLQIQKFRNFHVLHTDTLTSLCLFLQALCRACVPDNAKLQQLPPQLPTLVKKLIEQLYALLDPDQQLTPSVVADDVVSSAGCTAMPAEDLSADPDCVRNCATPCVHKGVPGKLCMSMANTLLQHVWLSISLVVLALVQDLVVYQGV